MKVKCIKDTEGYWSEGDAYLAERSVGGFIEVSDDDMPHHPTWSAMPIEYREDGSIVYQVGGIEGEVLFEEAGGDDGN